MTLVDQRPPVAPLSEPQARELTDSIAKTSAFLWDQVALAYEGRAWAALGYSSWDNYCAVEFDGARLRLPREERTMVVGSLSDAGLSTRAIAAALGVSKNTVTADLAEVSQFGTPDPDDVIADAEIVDVGEITHRPTVTGVDGKTYPKTKGTTPKPPAERAEEIRNLVALGLDSRQIADDLGMSATYVQDVARRHGVVLPDSVAGKELRWERAAEMAATGHTSQQIADDLGVSAEHVRKECRERDIEIPADALIGRSRNLSSTRIVDASVRAVDGIGILFPQIDFTQLHPEDVKGWLPILDESIRSLTTLRNQLRKASQP